MALEPCPLALRRVLHSSMERSIGSSTNSRSTASDSTWIIVTSAYGQAPIDQRKRHLVPETQLRRIADSIQPRVVAHLSTGDVGLIWLRDSSMSRLLVKAYAKHAAELGIQEIYSDTKIGLTLNPPET